MPALIPASQFQRISGQMVTVSGQRVQVANDVTLMVRDSGNFASTANLALTGSQAWNAANDNGINISGNMAATGAALIALNLATSGVLASQIAGASAGVSAFNGASGAVTLNSASPGITIVQSGSNTFFISGAASIDLVTGMSGQAVIDYATKVQLTNSGVTLIADIVGLSGATNTLVAATGAAAVTFATTFASSIGSTISGNLTTTGSTLDQKINSLSGFFTGAEMAFYSGLNPTGLDTYQIWFQNYTFPSIPKVQVELELSGSNVFYNTAISGRTTSGFFLLLSDLVGESGVGINVFAKI